jgi:hypothetical protein
LTDELKFQKWVKDNRVPFEDSPAADYDMRGFWKGLMTGDPQARTAINPYDNRMHFPDKWKTPYHESFSSDSQYAKPNAARWTGNDAIGFALRDNLGNIISDERTPQQKAQRQFLIDVGAQ